MKIFLLLSLFNIYANEEFIIGRMSAKTKSIEFAKKVTNKIYNKLGIKHHFKSYPYNRSIHFLNLGETHSEVCRYGDFDTKYQNIIKVSPPIITSGVAIYYKKDSLKEQNTIEKISKYIVGSMQGAGYTKKLNTLIKTQNINKIDSLFEMINKDRVDFVAFPEIEFQEKVQKFKLKRLNIPEISVDLKCHHYLNKKYKYLAPKISKEIKKLIK
jgi:hypothetical protein